MQTPTWVALAGFWVNVVLAVGTVAYVILTYRIMRSTVAHAEWATKLAQAQVREGRARSTAALNALTRDLFVLEVRLREAKQGERDGSFDAIWSQLMTLSAKADEALSLGIVTWTIGPIMTDLRETVAELRCGIDDERLNRCLHLAFTILQLLVEDAYPPLAPEREK